MALDKINHYSLTDAATVYDEEAMTALQLVARCVAKLNQAIDAYNKLESDTDSKLTAQDAFIEKMNSITIPEEVKTEVNRHIQNGDFDRAINTYIGDIENRLDNLLGSVTTGTTTMDAEIIDGRVSADNALFNSLGTAIRAQVNDLLTKHRKVPDITALAHGCGIDHNAAHLWEQGHFANGVPSTNQAAPWFPLMIRTKNFLSHSVELIACQPGYDMDVQRYKKDGTFVDEIFCEFFSDINHEEYNYKVGLRRTTLSAAITNHNIYPDEYINVSFCEKGNFHISLISNPVENMKAQSLGFLYGLNHPCMWRQGHLNDYGEEGRVDSAYYTTRITSGYIPSEVEKIETESGYFFNVFIYDKNGTFKRYVDTSCEYHDFNHENERYRISLKHNRQGVGVDITPTEWHHIHFLAQSLNTNKSGFNQNIKFGIPPTTTFYSPTEPQFDFNNSTTTAEIYAAYAKLDGENPGRIDCVTLGNASDGQPVYCYHFKPRKIDDSEVVKIIITTGVHGFEKSSVFGLYHLMCDICNNWNNSPTLEYLRNHVEFIIIPCANPWGLDHNEYKNKNGVNINRNFGYGWSYVEDKTSVQYSGESAFDQPETTFIRDVLYENPDAFLYIDYHTNGGTSVTNWADVNWIALCNNQDGYYNRLGECAKRHIISTTEHLNKDYGLELSHEELTGRFTGLQVKPTVAGYSDEWGSHIGIMSMTFEGFNGFPNRSPFTHDVYKANASLICSWIMHIIHEYKGG